MFLLLVLLAQDNKDVVYQYKRYEKFDLTAIKVDADGVDFPRDVSVTPRFYKKYKNKLPYKTSFNNELAQSITRIK